MALDRRAQERQAIGQDPGRAIHREEGGRGGDAAEDRDVGADHRVLDGVRDEQDEDEVERRHLAELARAR